MLSRVLPVASIFVGLASAIPCITFDSDFNLYAFGVQGQNSWALGSEDGWASGSGPNVTTVDMANAPPFDGSNTQCFLAQFFNSIYVLDGDQANPSSVHIFDVDSKTWSVQATQASDGLDLTTATAILDHDTNVFFALSGGNLYQLDMTNQNTAKSDTLSWYGVGEPSFNSSGYDPVMAIANNHIFFLDVPGNPAGDANIFVIHFAYFQPDAQTFTGKGFPAIGGQTASIWQPSTTIDAQTEFAFFPSDGSSTYIFDVIHNSTTTLPYPPAPPSSGYSSFAASTDTLVQLTPSGEVYYIGMNGTLWNKIPNALWSSPSSQIAPTTSNGGAGSAAATKTGTSSSTSSATPSNASSSGAVSTFNAGAWLAAGLVGSLAGAMILI